MKRVILALTAALLLAPQSLGGDLTFRSAVDLSGGCDLLWWRE